MKYKPPVEGLKGRRTSKSNLQRGAFGKQGLLGKKGNLFVVQQVTEEPKKDEKELEKSS